MLLEAKANDSAAATRWQYSILLDSLSLRLLDLNTITSVLSLEVINYRVCRPLCAPSWIKWFVSSGFHLRSKGKLCSVRNQIQPIPSLQHFPGPPLLTRYTQEAGETMMASSAAGWGRFCTMSWARSRSHGERCLCLTNPLEAHQSKSSRRWSLITSRWGLHAEICCWA